MRLMGKVMRCAVLCITVIALLFMPAGVGMDRQPGATEKSEDEGGRYLRAVMPVPVYSIADIPSLYYAADGYTPHLRLDDKGHMRELEFIALKGTRFDWLGTLRFGDTLVYRVATQEYAGVPELYVDARYVERSLNDYPPRVHEMPSAGVILQRLESMVGLPYCWGGNYPSGIEAQLERYPVERSAEAEAYIRRCRSKWILEGVDCSGMLYAATDGTTLRNTSDLVCYGEAVPIYGLTAAEIVRELEPLDLIVWKGHVLVVFDKGRVIESRPRYTDGHAGGVRIEPLLGRLEEIMQTRRPVDDYSSESQEVKRFVVRRFMGDSEDY